MAKEWKQICKDCGKPFGYSDISLQKDLRKGLSRPERCHACRYTHSQAIKTIASSHFALKPRNGKPSILGYEYLGHIEHEKRGAAEADFAVANSKGIDIGLNESNILEVYEALDNNQVVVVMAPTGSGKSTFIPCKLLNPIPPKAVDYYTRRGPIIITQPRIAATIQIPNAVGSRFCGSSVGAGFDIGYCYSGDKVNYDLKRNRMVFTTDGSLINWIADGMLGEFSMIVVDEAHERSYNIESIINMVYRELPKYPDLKVMIISATIDSDSFKNFFSATTKVQVLNFDKSEKTFGYEEAPWKWKDLTKKDFDEKIFEQNKRKGEAFLESYKANVAYRLAERIIEILRKTKHGGILGFLDGKDNINTAVNLICDELDPKEDIRVFPFHGELSDEDRDAVINYNFKGRRVLIATNSAETSLTLEDVVFVVDSGLIKEEQWNSSTCRKGLETKFHSKAGCKQRWGRAGRVRKGYVEKLYTRDEFINFFPNYTIPAVQRSSSEPMILAAIASGQSQIDDFAMLTRPEEKEWQRALSVIRDRGIIDKEGDFTKEGLEIYELSKAVGYILGDSRAEYNSTERSLDVACLLLLADKYSCLIEAATTIAMMPHMGNSVYWEMDGLYKWNRHHNLITKDHMVRLHDSLKSGCIDDLDLSCKLYSLFEGNFFDRPLPAGYRDWFISEYNLNERTFESIIEVRNQLINRFCEGKKTDKFRKLNPSLVNRVRVLAALAWNNKVVSLKKVDQLLFENEKNKMVGAISENCAGDWTKEKKVIVGMLDQNEIYATVEKETNKRERVPVANFLIKYLSPVPKKNIIEIVTAFQKHQEEIDEEEKYRSLDCDIKLPISRKVNVDNPKKPKNITGSFSLSDSNLHSENEEDHFVNLNYKEIEKDNTYEISFEVPKNIKGEGSLMIEYWLNVKGKPVASLNTIPIPYSGDYTRLKLGAKIEATIIRKIFNIRGIGMKETAGFMIEVDKHHYAIPLENIFLDYEDSIVSELIGQNIELWKIGETPDTQQPIFSRTGQVEKERESVLRASQIQAKIIRKSAQEILCQVSDSTIRFPHFVKVPVAREDNDRRFLQMEGEVTLKVVIARKTSPPSIDCANDNKLDLTWEERDQNRKLVYQISRNKNRYGELIACGISIDKSRLIANKRIPYDQILPLCFEYPTLSEAFKFIHEKSWELTGEIQAIQKKVDSQDKVKNNILKNQMQLQEAYTSFSKLVENGRKLQEMINNARTESYKQERLNWLSENNAKLTRKMEWIETLKRFIKEDEDKLKG